MAATANTVVQLSVPDHLRGRVMSVYTTVFAGSTPVGGLLTGAIASGVGVQFAIGLGAVLSLLTGALSLSWLRGRRQPVMARATAAPAARAAAPRSTGPG